MSPPLPNSHPRANWGTIREFNPKLTDTTILIRYYQLNEVRPESYAGRGTPSGPPFSQRSRLVPVPRWLAPKSMRNFDAPHRQSCLPIKDPLKAKNFRVMCWMHNESRLLAKSPLNDTDRRAFMPARPTIPLKGSMFCPPRPRPSGSNALRAFGTILPGSTLRSYEVSKPLPRDTRGHILGASKQPKSTPIPIPIPPPGVARQSVWHPCPNGARVMAQRMNLARKKWNTTSHRTDRLFIYTQLASNSLSPEAVESLLPTVERAIHTIDGICAYTKKMAVIEGSEARHEEARAVIELRDFFHALLQSVQKPTAGYDSPSLQPDHPRDDPAAAKGGRQTDSQHYSGQTPEQDVKTTIPFATRKPTTGAYHHQPTSTNASTSAGSTYIQPHIGHPSIHATPSIDNYQTTPNNSESVPCSVQEVPSVKRQQTPLASGPKPRQKRSRAPAPSTRVLRSMTKVKADQHSMPTPGAVDLSTARCQPGKQPKANRVPPTSENIPASVPVGSTSATTRYNFRPRKRDRDENEVSGRGSKQTSRPTKRRRA